MGIRKMRLVAFIVALLVLGAIAFQWNRPAANPIVAAEWKSHEEKLGTLDVQLKEMAGQIQAAQGSGKCTEDSQCRVVGLGGRVCDRQKDFLIYSTVDADEPLLLRFVNEFNRLHEERLHLSLQASQCGVDPGPIRCIDQKCGPAR